MKNRFTINLFIEKDGNISRRNFSIKCDNYDKKVIESEVIKKLNLNESKWIIETNEEWEYIEKENVIFWKTKLKEVK